VEQTVERVVAACGKAVYGRDRRPLQQPTVILDTSKGLYVTDAGGNIAGQNPA